MDQFSTLSDYRTRVTDIYANVRRNQDPAEAWSVWRRSRDTLFATHPQSPLDPTRRSPAYETPFGEYDPAFRVSAALTESTVEAVETEI